MSAPDSPTNLIATIGDQQVTITFTDPNDNGSAITNYEYSTDGGSTFQAFSPVQASSPVTISGLTNGVTYSIELQAVNSIGTGSPSADVSATPSTTPNAPTSLVATKGNQQISVAFTAGSNGGSAITNYEYSTDNGSSFQAFSPAQTSSPVVITGLTNGTAYSVQLKTVNANGASSASSTVTSTPSTTPEVPTSLVATHGDQQISVAFTAGATGGSAITNYEYSTDGGSSFQAFSPAQTSSPVVITGLTNGTAYSVQLKTVNANGTSSASSTVSSTPSTTPDVPTSLVATKGSQQISVAFTPGSNGGSAITNYEYSTDNGSTFQAFSPAQTSSPVVITGLTNGTAYSIKLKTVNANGASSASSTVSSTPSTTPNAPTGLSYTTGDSQVSINFTPGSNGGSVITNYQYSTDGGSTFQAFSPAQTSSPVTITGLTNGTSYTVQLKTVNANGTSNASASVTAITIPAAPTSLVATYGNQQTSIAFTPGPNGGSAITNYSYSTDNGSSYQNFSPTQASSPVVITGLTNGTAYTIKLKAINAIGTGAASSAVSSTPSTIPTAPSIASSSRGDQQIVINLSATSDGGSAITNYQYSIDNGSSYQAFSPAQTSSPITITGLTNGTSYTVRLKAVNVNGVSSASSSTTLTPATTPSPPTLTTATKGNQQISVAFTAGNNGGETITNYSYSTNNGASYTLCSPAQTSSPIVITGLTNGTTYTVKLRALNAVGYSLASNALSATPSTIPNAPTSLVATHGNQQTSIAFTAGSTGGSALTDYLYSTNGGSSYASSGVTSSPIVITGLTNGTTYSVVLKAVNANGNSSASSSVSTIPSTTPSAPTSLVATHGDTQVSVAFTAGSNGGAAITNYQYSTDNGSTFQAFSPAQASSPVVITGLSNGTSYSIKLKAMNLDGTSSASSTVSSTPSKVPEPPTNLSYTTGDAQVSIAFTAPNNNGAVITNYQYSTNGGSSFQAFSPAQTSSPVTISGLTNGTSYSVKLKAVNVDGASSASSAVTAITIPATPTSLVATHGDQQVSVAFTAGSTGGSAITNYQYSTDGGSTYQAFSTPQTSSPVVITGLTNGTTYSIKLKAVNAIGTSNASSSVSSTPSKIPNVPTNLSYTTGDTQLSISFTAPNNNGAAITNYQYSTNGGSSFQAFSPAQTSSPVTISGLTNGTSYSIQLKAVNLDGASSASSAITAITIPVYPTNLVATHGDQQVSVAFTPGNDGGSTITNYQYSTDGGSSFQAFSPAQASSPVTITGLTNGTSYSIKLKTVNAIGTSNASSTVSSIPSRIPDAPTNLSYTTGDTQLTIAFTAPNNNGATITNYQYSTDGGSSFQAFSPAQTSSPVHITGLTNGTSYSVQLKAVNLDGPSAASSSLTAITIPVYPSNLVATHGDQQVSIAFTAGNTGGSAVTNYMYSTNGGSSYQAFSPAQTTSPVVITGLTNGTSYNMKLKTVNAVGTSNASSSVSSIPSRIPDAPTNVTALPANNKLKIYFTTSYNGGAAITNYQYSTNGGTSYQAFSPSQTTSPLIISGLNNGTDYTVLIKAVNLDGPSVASNSTHEIPCDVPTAPTDLIITTQDQQITVDFTQGFNGGAPITNYQYSLDGGSSFTVFSPAQKTSPVKIYPLTEQKRFRIVLQAINKVGPSASSSSTTLTMASISNGLAIQALQLGFTKFASRVFTAYASSMNTVTTKALQSILSQQTNNTLGLSSTIDGYNNSNFFTSLQTTQSNAEQLLIDSKLLFQVYNPANLTSYYQTTIDSYYDLAKSVNNLLTTVGYLLIQNDNEISVGEWQLGSQSNLITSLMNLTTPDKHILKQFAMDLTDSFDTISVEVNETVYRMQNWSVTSCASIQQFYIYIAEQSKDQSAYTSGILSSLISQLDSLQNSRFSIMPSQYNDFLTSQEDLWKSMYVNQEYFQDVYDNISGISNDTLYNNPTPTPTTTPVETPSSQ
jgi:large repetitive protein